MKSFILLLVLFTSFSLFAQNDVASSDNEWMAKISSDSEMRIQIMNMMVEKTKDNPEEMKKLANSISNNPELVKIIVDANPERAGSDDLSIDPLGVKKDDIKVGKTTGTQPVPKPKQ